MEMVSGMRRQIIGLLRSLGLVRMKGPGNMRDLNTNSRNWSVIKAVVGSGLYPNFIKVCLLVWEYVTVFYRPPKKIKKSDWLKRVQYIPYCTGQYKLTKRFHCIVAA